MRIGKVLFALLALVGIGIGGMLAMRSASAYAASDEGGFVSAVSGVIKNGLNALGDGGEVRIRTASSPADEAEGDAPKHAIKLRKAMKAVPSTSAIRIEHLGMLPEGFEDEPGVLVSGVQTDGPAAVAGLSRGDIIVGLDNAVIDTLDDLHEALAGRQVGETVSLDVMHGDDRLNLNVSLEDLDGSAWLGIAPCGAGMHAVPGFGAINVEIHGAGAQIMGLEPGGPAEAAGVLEGEMITAVDGVEVDPMNDLGDVLSGYAPGDSVVLTLAPAGSPSVTIIDTDGEEVDEASENVFVPEMDVETRDVSVTLGEHPEDAGRAFLGVQYGMEMIGGHGGDFDFNFDAESLGLHHGFDLEHLDALKGMHGDSEGGPSMFKWFGGSEDHEGMESFSFEGAIVSEIAADGPASSSGLGEGDVITSIDGEPVDSPEALAEMISARAPGEAVTLSVTNHTPGEDEASEAREIEVVLGEHPDDAGAGFLGVTVGGFMSIERIIGGDGEDGASFQFGPKEGGGIFRFFRGPEGNEPLPVPAMPVDGGTL